MKTHETRTLAFIGIALPFALMIMGAIFPGILGSDPLKPLLVSFFFAMVLYVPWINETFKQSGMMVVSGIAFAVLVFQFILAIMLFAIMFAIGGGTI